MQNTKTAKSGFKVSIAHENFLYSGKTPIATPPPSPKRTMRVVSAITYLYTIEDIIKSPFLVLTKPQKDTEIWVREASSFLSRQ